MTVLIHGTATGYSKGCRCDECREASVAQARRRREREFPRMPYAPLAELLKDRGVTNIPLYLRVSHRTVKDWEQRGLSLIVADKIAVRLHKHPMEIFGQAWLGADA